MDLTEKVGRIFMIGLPSHKFDDRTKEILDRMRPGSVILFSRNIVDREQVSRYIEHIGDFLGYKPLMAVDQEGGIVTRLRKGFSQSPGAMALVSEKGPGHAYTAAKIIAEEMKSAGFDWDLSPVVDINNSPDNPAIGIRSFSSRKEQVVLYARESVRGLHDGGVISCLKHFPGNGRVVTDPHLDMPVLEADREEIFRNEMFPFREVEAPTWMPTHLYSPALQSRREPATVSREVLTGWVRDKLGYEGLLIADDLNMGGVSLYYPPAELAYKTLMAGMDMLSFCDNGDKQIDVKNQLEQRFREEEPFRMRAEEAAARVDALFDLRARYEEQPAKTPDFSSNGKIMDSLSFHSVKVMSNVSRSIPLQKGDNVFTIKTSRLVLIEERESEIPSAAVKCARLLDCPLHFYEKTLGEEEKKDLLAKGKGGRNILFTENAHLSPGVRELVTELAELSENLVLVALRNPYDCEIEGVENSICSFGYNEAQMEGIINLLFEGRGNEQLFAEN